MRNRLVIALIIIIILALIAFVVYKAFFGREETLGDETFVMTFIDTQDDTVRVDHLLLVDCSGDSMQFIMIPVSLKCEVPGLSRMPLEEMYPFGGSSIMLEAVSNSLDINPGYYFTVEKDYMDEIIKNASPLSLASAEDLSFDSIDLPAGENMLQEKDIRSFLDYSYDSQYEDEFLDNKRYIISRLLQESRSSSLLLDESSPYLRDTNLEPPASDRINSIYASGEIYFYMLDPAPSGSDISTIRDIINDSYRDRVPGGIVRFYPEPVQEPEVQEPEVQETVEAEEEAEIEKEDLNILALNGNFIPGSATATAERVEELGYTVLEVGNVEDAITYEHTLIFHRPGLEGYALEIGDYLGVEEQYIQVSGEVQEGIDMTIITGLDYQEE